MSLFLKRISGVLRFLYFKIALRTNLRSTGFYVVQKGSKFVIKNKGTITVGKMGHFSPYSTLSSKKKLLIGDNFNIQNYSRVVAFEEITIGNNVTIAQFVSVLDHDHDYIIDDGRMILKNYKTKPITIGSNVWIADKVTILKGVTIGDNVIIGANSLVNMDIPNNSIAAGNPVKILKKI